MHCSFLTRVVPCCLHGWHQCFLSYVASCSLGEVAFNNRTHCILRMFPDSVSICHFVAPVESFKSFASCPAFCVCSQAAAIFHILALCFASHMLLFFESWLSTTGYQFCSYHPLYISLCVASVLILRSFLFLQGRPHLLCPIASSSRVAAH